MLKKLVIIVLACAMIMPVLSADWDFYGRSYMIGWFEVPDDGIEGTDDISYLNFAIDGMRFGMKMKSDLYEGRLEGGKDGDGKVYWRHSWLKWNINEDLNFMVGQTYTPMTIFPSGMCSSEGWGLLNCGIFYAGRRGMLQLGFKDFKIALVQATGSTVQDDEKSEDNIDFVYIPKTGDTTIVPGITGQRRSLLPKIEMYYKYGPETWHVGVGAGFQMYTLQVKEKLADTKNTDVNIMSIVFNADFGLDMEKFYFNLAGSGGINYGAYGGAAAVNANSVYQYTESGTKSELLGQMSFGGVAAAGFKINDMLKPEVGFGYMTSSRSGAKQLKAGKWVEEEADAAMRIYAQLNIMSPEEIITFVPEFGYEDNMTNAMGVDEAKKMYIGVYTIAAF